MSAKKNMICISQTACFKLVYMRIRLNDEVFIFKRRGAEQHLLRNDLIVGILMLFFGRPPLIIIIRPPDWTFLSDSNTIANHKGLFYSVE